MKNKEKTSIYNVKLTEKDKQAWKSFINEIVKENNLNTIAEAYPKIIEMIDETRRENQLPEEILSISKYINNATLGIVSSFENMIQLFETYKDDLLKVEAEKRHKLQSYNEGLKKLIKEKDIKIQKLEDSIEGWRQQNNKLAERIDECVEINNDLASENESLKRELKTSDTLSALNKLLQDKGLDELFNNQVNKKDSQ